MSSGEYDPGEDNDLELVSYLDGNQSVLSAEGREDASFLEQQLNNSNMADDDVPPDGEEVVPVEPQLDEADVDDASEEELNEAQQAALLEAQKKERLENIVLAKSMVQLVPKNHQRARTNSSKIWKIFFVPKMTDDKLEEELKDYDPVGYSYMVNGKKDGQYIYICKLCYDCPTTPLGECFKKNSSATGPGNLPAHLRSEHPVIYAGYSGKPLAPSLPKDDNSNYVSPPKRQRQESSQASMSTATSMKKASPQGAYNPLLAVASKVSVDSSLTNSFSSIDSYLNEFVSFPYQHGKDKLVREFKELQHSFSTNNNLAAIATTNKGKRPEFHNLLMFAMKNGKQMLGENHLIMGTAQFNNFRKDKYTTLLAAIHMYVSESAEFYKSHLKLDEDVSFMIVGTDVWDSKNKEALGVTVFWYNPIRKKCYNIPLGLDVVDDKKSEPTAEQTLKLLELAGIKKSYIYKAVNDTTNTALKVGRLLTGGDQGTCSMHTIQLAMVHATGRVTRTIDGAIADEFPECEALRKKALLASGGIFDKKNKGKAKKYFELMQSCSRVAIKIQQPNSTRAGGIQIHLTDLLRSRWNAQVYWDNDIKAKTLSDEEFYQLAELHSILQPMAFLIKIVQTDRPGAIAFTHFFIFRTFASYIAAPRWYVANTKRSQHPEEVTKWDAGSDFPKSDYMGKPLPIESSDLTNLKREIPMVPVLTKNLTPMAKRLLYRCVVELKNYGAAPTKEHLLASACHPFMATHGMLELDLLSAFIDDNEEYKEIISGLDLDHKKAAIGVLVQEIKKVCSKIIPKDPPVMVPGELQQEVGDSNGDEVDAIERLRRKRQRASEKGTNQAVPDGTCPVMAQVIAFFDQQFDPRAAMAPDKHHLAGATSNDWIKNWEVIVANLEVFKWWEQVGRISFPLIYPIACRILPLPDSNGSQERTFSAATWMDGKLAQSQSDMTFQMKVLLYKNQAFLEEHKKDVQESQKREAEIRTKALLAKRTKTMNDEDIEDDLEDLLEAYGVEQAEAEEGSG